MKEVKDELNEGDQVLVRVLGIEGNRIKLSRKALLKEQRQKLGLPEPGVAGDIQGSTERAPRNHAPVERQPSSNASTITIEGGDDFDEVEGGDDLEGDDEPNFNRVDGAPTPVGAAAGGGSGSGAGPAGQRRRRRRSGGSGGGPWSWAGWARAGQSSRTAVRSNSMQDNKGRVGCAAWPFPRRVVLADWIRSGEVIAP